MVRQKTALFCKLKSLESAPRGQLAGKICTVIDIVTRLPVEVWFHPNPRANDTNFEVDLLKLVTAKTLLLQDLRFLSLPILSYSHQPTSRLYYPRSLLGLLSRLSRSTLGPHSVRDQLIKLGTGRNGAPILTLRLVEIRCGKTWYSYITSVLDPTVLPPYVVADLYRRRWHLEKLSIQ